MIRDHGSRIRYLHEVMGVNARLDEMQAAVLLVKMPHLEHWNAARQRHAQIYTEQLRDVVEAVPVIKPLASHVFCYYVVQVNERDQFRRALEREGIGTKYP